MCVKYLWGFKSMTAHQIHNPQNGKLDRYKRVIHRKFSVWLFLLKIERNICPLWIELVFQSLGSMISGTKAENVQLLLPNFICCMFLASYRKRVCTCLWHYICKTSEVIFLEFMTSYSPCQSLPTPGYPMPRKRPSHCNKNIFSQGLL